MNVAGFQRRRCNLNLSNRRISTCIAHGDNGKLVSPLREDHQVDEVCGRNFSKDCGINLICNKSINLMRTMIKHAIITVEINGRAIKLDDLLFKKNIF